MCDITHSYRSIAWLVITDIFICWLYDFTLSVMLLWQTNQHCYDEDMEHFDRVLNIGIKNVPSVDRSSLSSYSSKNLSLILLHCNYNYCIVITITALSLILLICGSVAIYNWKCFFSFYWESGRVQNEFIVQEADYINDVS